MFLILITLQIPYNPVNTSIHVSDAGFEVNQRNRGRGWGTCAKGRMRRRTKTGVSTRGLGTRDGLLALISELCSLASLP
jgi:hypothetical protein